MERELRRDSFLLQLYALSLETHWLPGTIRHLSLRDFRGLLACKRIQYKETEKAYKKAGRK